MHYYLSFVGRSNCKDRIQTSTKSLHLPSRISGMCMRKDEQRKGDHIETDFTGRRGTKGKQQIEKRKASDL